MHGSVVCPLPGLEECMRIQNIAARIVTRSKTSDDITHVLRQLHWLPIIQRITFKVILQVFKCVYGIALVSIFKTSFVHVSNHELWSFCQHLLNVPFTRHSWLAERAFGVAHACGMQYHQDQCHKLF